MAAFRLTVGFPQTLNATAPLPILAGYRQIAAEGYDVANIK